MIPTAEQLDELFKAGAMKRLGMGSRRACYAIPDTNLCVKCYRSDEEIAEGKYPEHRPIKPLAASVVREIQKYRFDEKRNTCCQEYRYWNKLRSCLPADLMASFPATMDMLLLPVRGWCVVEELVVNADGSPMMKFREAWLQANGSMRKSLLVAFDALVERLERYAVRMYDPQTIFVQTKPDGTILLRIVDFEPASRTLIALDNFFPSIVRLKLCRRFRRYRKLFAS